ncbi:MAG: RHS repeat-associated core domain-containing protein [Pyrinomonadaceae bacterium]
MQRGQQTLLDLSYDYNRNNSVGTLNGKTGHLSKIINNLNANKNREYGYDALGRLTTAKGGTNNLWTQNYSYDRYGNRTSVTASGVAADNTTIPRDGIANLAYDTTGNRITTAGFEYDVAGNQTRALAEDGVSWLKFEYDSANRLVVVRRDDGTAIQSFQYGATNARLIAYNLITYLATIYVSNGGTTLAEYTEFGANVPTWTKSYVYLGDSMLSTVTPNGQGGEFTEFNHPDRLGTRTITNQQAGTSSEQTTLPFGTALDAESTRTNNPKRFTSYDRSARTGLDYAVNRTYDSKQGRFTSVDPIGMGASSLASPQTLNLYSYCGNDPINHTDPSGLFWGSLFRTIGKIFNFVNKVLKWVAIAVAVILIVAVIVYTAGGAMPAFLGNFMGSLLGVLGKIGAGFSSFMAGAITASGKSGLS